MRTLCLAVSFLFSCYSVAQQQQYTFRSIDVSDGLLNNRVVSIGQDAQGFMWFLTLSGLQRYDGSRFVNYPSVVNNSSAPTMESCELFIDNDNQRIDVLKWDSIEQLDLKSQKIETIRTVDAILSPGSKFDTLTDENGTRWLFGVNGIVWYEKDSRVPMDKLFNYWRNSHRSAYCSTTRENNHVWMTYRPVHFFDLVERKKYTSTNPGNQTLLKYLRKTYGETASLRNVFCDHEGNVYGTTWGPSYVVYKYHADVDTVEAVSFLNLLKRQHPLQPADSTVTINTLIEDSRHHIWFGTDQAGLIHYDPETDNYEFILADEKLRNTIRYNFSIKSLFQDRQENIWIGTDKGVSVFNPYSHKFNSVYHIPNEPASLPQYEITDMLQISNGKILVSTWGGGITVYDHDWNFEQNIVNTNGYRKNLAWCFIENTDGSIWSGAQEGFLSIYDPELSSHESVSLPEARQSTIRIMARDSSGHTLLGLNNGRILVYEPSEQRFLPYDDQSDGVSFYDYVTNIFVDADNQCWVGTGSDLRLFDTEKHIYTAVYGRQAETVTNSVSGHIGFPTRVYGIDTYNDSLLILATDNGGPLFFNKNHGTFDQNKIPASLIGESAFAVRVDSQKNIWLSTNTAVCKFNIETGGLIQYNLSETLTSQFEGPRFYTLQNKEWATFTATEIISFLPDKLDARGKEPLLTQICDVEVFEKLYFPEVSPNSTPIIALPFDQNFVTIHFSDLDYAGNQTSRYTYRLSDVDKSWVLSEGSDFAHYSDLKPGKYLFEVKAQHAAQRSTPASIQIVITPPWYGTWFFRIAAIALLVSTVYWFIRARIQNIRKEGRFKHQIARMEMQALRAQMNPHFIFNCINSIDAMIQSDDKYRATVYLNKFARLIRNVLESSKHERIPLSRDIETLKLYIELELFRHHYKFTSEVQISEEILNGDYKVPPLIVQPYVENAIHHGLHGLRDSSGKLFVSVTCEHDHLLYRIEDNGIGRSRTALRDNPFNGNGMGMQMSSDRIRLFNDEEEASVMVTDLYAGTVPNGTRVDVKLKIK